MACQNDKQSQCYSMSEESTYLDPSLLIEQRVMNRFGQMIVEEEYLEDKEKRRLWEERLKMFLASGQDQRAWSREQELPGNQLGYWLRKFKSEAKEPDGTHWVSLKDTGRPESGVSLRIGWKWKTALTSCF
jgi:hypothetical protein